MVACFAGSHTNAYSDNNLDIQAGKNIYTRCTGCHTYDYHRTGPKHCGLVGRKAGSTPGFEYTQAMKDSDIIWTAATLEKFLYSPMDMIPGTSMGFSGITSPTELKQLTAFLLSLSDLNPLCQ